MYVHACAAQCRACKQTHYTSSSCRMFVHARPLYNAQHCTKVTHRALTYLKHCTKVNHRADHSTDTHYAGVYVDTCCL